MGNTGSGINIKGGELGAGAMKGWPLGYHTVHSDNIQLSPDRRRARRIESFCKGICFGGRPIALNERIYVKFAEVSTNWSGVVRFGFMSHDPVTVNPAELPRYACPDLTNKPGYWAKALPEKYAEQGTILLFYLTRNGDVMFGINGEEKGIFFSGVTTGVNLWPLVDIYGNTLAMEFVDGRQLNNMAPPTSTITTSTTASIDPSTQPSSLSTTAATATSLPNIPVAVVRHHHNPQFMPLTFHPTLVGRNVRISPDRTVAVRFVEEYCNGYVFTEHPIRCGDKLVIQILSVEKVYCGSLAFGLTSCDPSTVMPGDLPDDSDLLLDRAEYWVVNKDVYSAPEIGDELCFYLNEEGEVKYAKNNHQVGTLMHVDKTLPLWAFFDVYGNTQKIKLLGVPNQSQGQLPSGLTVALPPASANGQSVTPNRSMTPPRPPPPRSSPNLGLAIGHGRPPVEEPGSPPPTLPPKQYRPPGLGQAGSQSSVFQSVINSSNPGLNLPAPLIPTPILVAATNVPPQIPPRNHSPAATPDPPPRPTHIPKLANKPMTDSSSGEISQEAQDNACNECTICMENAVDTVLYTCGHACVCHECAINKLKVKSGGATCPICRLEVKDVIKVYRS